MPLCLIAEDNPVNWMIMQNQMKKLGFEIVLCKNGREALNFCTTQRLPDMILLDGYMPEMDGIEFLERFRALPGQEGVYIVFCSSSLEREDIERALTIRADCHYPKPIRNEQLLEAIESWQKRIAVSGHAALAEKKG
jgi:putative two-component system response regulator